MLVFEYISQNCTWNDNVWLNEKKSYYYNARIKAWGSRIKKNKHWHFRKNGEIAVSVLHTVQYRQDITC